MLLICTSCQSQVTVPAGSDGKAFRCPYCKQSFTVPQSQAVAENTPGGDLYRCRADMTLKDVCTVGQDGMISVSANWTDKTEGNLRVTHDALMSNCQILCFELLI